MIKINLLLTRKEKKKVGMKKEFIVLIVSVFLLLGFFILVQWKMDNEKEKILGQITEKKKETDNYKNQITEINKAKASQKIVQDKLNVINSLRKQKASPARVLDEISICKPEKIQLESLRKDGTKLGIEGVALDDETVANFMTNLRKSKIFKNVDLIVSEQIEQSKVKVKRFVLSCEIFLM
jgi:type IV pilus assembly protein PilN